MILDSLFGPQKFKFHKVKTSQKNKNAIKFHLTMLFSSNVIKQGNICLTTSLLSPNSIPYGIFSEKETRTIVSEKFFLLNYSTTNAKYSILLISIMRTWLRTMRFSDQLWARKRIMHLNLKMRRIYSKLWDNSDGCFQNTDFRF